MRFDWRRRRGRTERWRCSVGETDVRCVGPRGTFKFFGSRARSLASSLARLAAFFHCSLSLSYINTARDTRNPLAPVDSGQWTVDSRQCQRPLSQTTQTCFSFIVAHFVAVVAAVATVAFASVVFVAACSVKDGGAECTE